MSANNYILINQDSFEVSVCNADTGNSYGKPRKARNLENAIEIAQQFEKESPIEYGIAFTKSKITKRPKTDNKTYVYIDGTNLLAGLAKLFGVNKIPKFKSVVKELNKLFEIYQIYFYASYTSQKRVKDPKILKYIKLEKDFFNQVKNTKNLYFYKGYRSLSSKKEKGVDVHLAVDIVQDAIFKKYNKAVIFSGDADFAYALEVVKKLNYSVYSVFLPNRFSLAIAFQSLKPTILNYKNTFNINNTKKGLAKLRIIKMKDPA